MPKLYELDDINECKGKFEKNWTYCIVNFQINNDTKSDIFDYIMKFSSESKRHLRHDKLIRGVCLNSCALKSAVKEDKAKIIDECLNKDLKTKFNLSGQTKINYCLDEQDEHRKTEDRLGKFLIKF